MGITFVDSDSSITTTTTHTFVGLGVGSTAGRKVALAFAGTQVGGDPVDITSVTVDGVNATELLTVAGGLDAGGNRVYASLWVLESTPDGTTEDVVLTSVESLFDCHVASWELVDVDTTIYDSAQDSFGAADTPADAALVLDFPEDGVGFGAVAIFPLGNDPADVAWLEFTERANPSSFGTNQFSFADFSADADHTPLVAGVDFDNTLISSALTMAAAAVSFEAQAVSALASTSSASVAWVGAATSQSVMASAGVAAVSWDAEAVGDLVAAGIGAADFVGALDADGVLASAGVAVGALVGSPFDAAISANGVSTLLWSSLQAADGVLESIGVADDAMWVSEEAFRWTPEATAAATWTPEGSLQ